jgi:hypothetical protein
MAIFSTFSHGENKNIILKSNSPLLLCSPAKKKKGQKVKNKVVPASDRQSGTSANKYNAIVINCSTAESFKLQPLCHTQKPRHTSDRSPRGRNQSGGGGEEQKY